MRGGWFSVAAGLILAASLALKFVVQDVSVAEDPEAAVTTLTRNLAQAGYTASIPDPAIPAVRAIRGDCVFTARVLDPHGTYHNTQLRKRPRDWRVAYAWRGAWYPALPRFAPLGDYYLARELARAGLRASRTPVVMLSLGPGCGLPDVRATETTVPLIRAAPANRAPPA